MPNPHRTRVRPGLAPREHEGTRLLAMSFDSGSSPSVTLRALSTTRGRSHPYGWGFAWYPEQSAAALLVKDATSLGDNAMTKLLREWERFQSTLFVCHLRGAARALREEDTHPFARVHGGRDWVFAHNGDLEAPEHPGGLVRALDLGDDPVFEPVGRTDSERAFCWILRRARDLKARSLADIGWERLHDWFRELDDYGTANFLIADGSDLVVYGDADGYNRIHFSRVLPPNLPKVLEAEDLDIGLEDAVQRTRTVTLFSTAPMKPIAWIPMHDSQMVVVRRGAFIFDSHADPARLKMMVSPLPGTPVLAEAPHMEPVQTTEAPRMEQGQMGFAETPFMAQVQTGLQPAANGNESPERAPNGGNGVDTPPEGLALTAPENREPPVRAKTPAEANPPPTESSDDGTHSAAPRASSVVDAKPPAASDLAESAEPPESTPKMAPDASVPKSSARRITIPPLHHHALCEGEGRLLSVVHETVYRYVRPVERSFHLIRLQPVHDRWQDLLQYDFQLSAEGVRRDYVDVFENHICRVDIDTPYQELRMATRSLVRVRHSPPDDLHSPHRRFTIPLVWMPWQRQMMTPYLLPPELPETQLQELTEFAMSFVERQDYDLVQTLMDMNTTIYRDFAYVSGSTTMATTPFEVFVRRKGVCQDFANLFICLARLLGVPARYRVGYIYTGGDYENKVQSDASHAWAELYLPWTGWQGFDPTNGCLVGTDHIRVACGRNYGDATPTSGTLYRGGGKETLTVVVRVEEVSP